MCACVSAAGELVLVVVVVGRSANILDALLLLLSWLSKQCGELSLCELVHTIKCFTLPAHTQMPMCARVFVC